MKKNKWIYALLMFLPIFDLITSLQARSEVFFSVGSIIKGLCIITTFIYIFFFSSSKYKKISIIYLGSIVIYAVGYFVSKNDLLNASFFLHEIKYLLRMAFFPTMFVFFLNYFSEYGLDKKRFIRAMIISLMEYTVLLLFPLLFNIAFESYSTGLHGYVGWYYAANEISVIVVLLLPFIYYLLNKKGIFNFFVSLPVLYVIACIGTKVTFMGTLIVTTISFIYYLIKNKFRINYQVIGSFMILVFSLVFFLDLKKVTIDNVKMLAESQSFEFIDTPITSSIDRPEEIIQEEQKEDSKFNELLHFLLSDRDIYFRQTKNIYLHTYQKNYALYGMGFSNTSRVNNPNVVKLIEIDYLDLYYHMGIFSVILEIIPLLATFVVILHQLFKGKNDLKKVSFIIYKSLIISMTLSIAAIAGHVLLYPAVSIYLCIYLILLLDACNVFYKKPIDEKKVAILALHLNAGGIETVITNQANMLAENYHVEIISLYKSSKKIPYNLDKNVKVTYLLNIISNRKELYDALHKYQIAKLLKEVFKAVRILVLKPLYIKRAILNSDAKVIISSRAYFSMLLGRFHRDSVVTISEEHVYHNNDKRYISKVIKANKNVDYLLPTSKELTRFYQDRVNAKVEYIPNTINYYPKKLNSLNTKKIIAIGRLSKEKGFIDLIKVMSILTKKDSEIILDIYGEGEEKEIISSEIKKYYLENNVFLKGFATYEKLNEIRKNYSLILCSSYEESFGLAVLETMAFGVPCITYDDPKGILEFVSLDNGVIIKGRNAKMMAQAILKLINNPKKINKLSLNARKKSEEYSYDIIKQNFNNFILNAIALSKTINKKVMFISSCGGHLNELLQLKDLFSKYDFTLITEKAKTTVDLKNKYKNRCSYLLFGTKHQLFKYLFIVCPVNFCLSVFYFLKYQPKYIVSTGAHTAGVMCLLGKMFGSKIIFIESFANITSKSITGKIVYHFADVFIVQWDDMKKLYPNAINGGWIY